MGMGTTREEADAYRQRFEKKVANSIKPVLNKPVTKTRSSTMKGQKKMPGKKGKKC
jgi:hypothetical protein